MSESFESLGFLHFLEGMVMMFDHVKLFTSRIMVVALRSIRGTEQWFHAGLSAKNNEHASSLLLPRIDISVKMPRCQVLRRVPGKRLFLYNTGRHIRRFHTLHSGADAAFLSRSRLLNRSKACITGEIRSSPCHMTSNQTKNATLLYTIPYIVQYR